MSPAILHRGSFCRCRKSPPSSPRATSAWRSPPRPLPQAPTYPRVVGLKNPLSPATLPWRFPAKRAFIVGMANPTEREPAALVAKLAAVQTQSTGQLRAEFERLSGRPTGSWNREWLRRKVSWLVQETARQASDAVGVPTLAAEVRDVPRAPRLDAPIQVVPGRGVRDPRSPRPGTEIVRRYRGLVIRVLVRDDCYEWNGTPYQSLSAVAKAITGCHWNGKLFFGLTPRRRGKAQTERSTWSR